MTDYEKYLDLQASNAKLKERLVTNDIVFVQNEQNIQKAQVIKISEKSVKVKLLEGNLKEQEKNMPYVKVVKEGDKVALIWEAWRGLSGRGGYRWEREAYENLRIPVESIPKKVFLCEEQFLVVDKIYEKSYLQKVNTGTKAKLILK